MEVGEGLICIINNVTPCTVPWMEVEEDGSGHLHRQCASSVEVGERFICIIHSVSPSTLVGDGDRAHLHHPQCHSLWVEGLICIVHSVSSSTKIGGGANLYHPPCVSSSLGGDRGSFTISITVYHPQVEMGEGLIYIIHSVFPSTI